MEYHIYLISEHALISEPPHFPQYPVEIIW